MAKYKINQGDDFVSIETITDQNGDVVDLTGATVTFTIVDRNGDTIESIVVSSHTTPESGITTITATKEETALWSMGYFDVKLDVLLSSGVKYSETGNIEVNVNIAA